MITLLLIELVHLPFFFFFFFFFLKTSKATRFTVGFRIFDHMKLFDFANTWRSDDLRCLGCNRLSLFCFSINIAHN